MRSYRTIDIARKVGVHVNTVRLYEQIGFMSVVPRADNGYRIFSDKHLYQMKIARLIVHGKWPGKPIRDSGMKIVHAMKEWDLIRARKCSHEYVERISAEQEKALHAIKILEKWGNNIYASSKGETHNRKQAAAIIGTSAEVLRNWERRGLIVVPQKSNKRIYSSLEIERLQVIYIMLQANYKIAEISERLQLYDENIIDKISTEVVRRRDHNISDLRSHWLEVSDNARENALKIIDLLNDLF